MATDARFDRIQKIIPHDGADTLEIAIISNFPCVVKKGEFSTGDWCFYIRDDARLLGYDEYQEHLKHDEEASKSGDFVTQDEFCCTWSWQTSLLKYLGSSGRVKSIKLRKKVSMGILLKPEVVLEQVIWKLHITTPFTEAVFGNLNSQIADSATGAEFLKTYFGVGHWEMPISNSMGNTDARGPLISGCWKTDEENFQNIEDEMFPWNDEVLVTKKLDGSSCSISSTPEGDVHVMSRSMDLKLDCDNVYNRAAKNIIPLVKKLAEYYGETIVVRGEVTGAGINASKVNLDAKGEPTFNMFATIFPTAVDDAKRIGLYGTEWHFLEVNKKCKELTGYEIKTVPVEGVVVLTKDLLEEISDRPRSEGEGRVINTKSIMLPHFKSKSKDYLIHL